jgi:hypothetical protein
LPSLYKKEKKKYLASVICKGMLAYKSMFLLTDETFFNLFRVRHYSFQLRMGPCYFYYASLKHLCRKL